MDDNSTTAQQQTPHVRLFWLNPSSDVTTENLLMLERLSDALNKAISDGWDVVARTPIGNGLLYEMRRVDGGAK